MKAMLQGRKVNSFYTILCVSVLLLAIVSISPAQNQEPGMGQLKLEGSNIESLILRANNNQTKTIKKPQETITLPVGTYYVQQINLTNGFYCYTDYERITVSQDKPAEVKLGSPLKQTLTVRHQGRYLILTNKITGIGGEIYSDPNRIKKPSFTIYTGDKIIASGNFEYG
jgi:hypothetical protein